MNFFDKVKKYATSKVIVFRNANPFTGYHIISRYGMFLDILLGLIFTLFGLMVTTALAIISLNYSPVYTALLLFGIIGTILLFMILWGLIYSVILHFRKNKSVKKLLKVKLTGIMCVYSLGTLFVSALSFQMLPISGVIFVIVFNIFISILLVILDIYLVNHPLKTKIKIKLGLLIIFIIIMLLLRTIFNRYIIFSFVGFSLFSYVLLPQAIRVLLSLIYLKDIKQFIIEQF